MHVVVAISGRHSFSSVEWIDLDQDKTTWRIVVSTVMNGLFPQNSGNLLTS